MDTSAVTIGCYVRAASLGPSLDETFRNYDQRGAIDDLTVDVWPDEVVLTNASEETAPLAQYRRFQTWAERTGAALRPAFTLRERASLVSEQTVTSLVLPTACLAIHVDGELATVVPHRTDATTYTVEEALDDLSAPDRTVPASPADSSTDLPTPST